MVTRVVTWLLNLLVRPRWAGPLTAPRSLAELMDELDARQHEARTLGTITEPQPPWNHRYPEPWDDGSTPRCLP